jgi:hypothetical protein
MGHPAPGKTQEGSGWSDGQMDDRRVLTATHYIWSLMTQSRNENVAMEGYSI